ncbi:hypothetical protein [Actinoplanes sp. NPDC089786]|uniref:hypothetical protein n=1 Tax=Actinoplanes sp. NPDC089786 TaxID=3155185 RepID=UPI00343846E9
MTSEAYTNVASGDAEIGVQANVVHGDITVYQVAPDASPQAVFRVGVNRLNARMPDEARHLIETAVARGYETDEVRFYRLLALLSGRTLRQLGNDGLDSLAAICARLTRLDGGDPWTAGLRAVLALVTSLGAADSALVDKELGGLPQIQRDLIVDHLAVLLEGPVEDEMWRQSVQLAAGRRTAGDRAARVWTFFQPVPAGPRARIPRPAVYQRDDVLWTVFGLFALVFTVGNLISALIRRGDAAPVLGFLIAMAGTAAFVRYGSDWHFRRQRTRLKDQELHSWAHPEAPPQGFARGVDRLFTRYFDRYVPRGTDPTAWITNTAGIRQRLRDEVVEIYREERIGADQVAWLVRYLVSDVRLRWERATLLSYREELRTSARVKLICLSGVAAIVGGGLLVVATAGGAGALNGVLVVVAGWVALRGAFRLDSERRRVGADEAEYQAAFSDRQAAYHRWVRKLSVKPSDREMADWLESDRRLMVDEAMRHYRINASQIIAHAVIEGPASGVRRARVKHGPWRYSRYQIVLFLLTKDGVRQVNAHLDFEHISEQTTQRLNYRFDAVAAVRIDGIATQRQTFELTLVNGAPILVPVTDAIGEIEAGEDPLKLSRVSLDASGLPRTLEVLEGIAAEGKEWIIHQRESSATHLADLRHIVRDLISER